MNSLWPEILLTARLVRSSQIKIVPSQPPDKITLLRKGWQRTCRHNCFLYWIWLAGHAWLIQWLQNWSFWAADPKETTIYWTRGMILVLPSVQINAHHSFPLPRGGNSGRIYTPEFLWFGSKPPLNFIFSAGVCLPVNFFVPPEEALAAWPMHFLI